VEQHSKGTTFRKTQLFGVGEQRFVAYQAPGRGIGKKVGIGNADDRWRGKEDRQCH